MSGFSATLSLYLSMAAFALAASITPGPVNILVLSSGVQYGFRPSLRLVFGATAGFCLLLLLIGLGLHEMLEAFPQLTTVIQWAGVAFLLFMAWKLATFPSPKPVPLRQAPSQPLLASWLDPPFLPTIAPASYSISSAAMMMAEAGAASRATTAKVQSAETIKVR